jgi:hypothetical protein
MRFVVFTLTCFAFSSCATALNPGPLTAYQKRKPSHSQARRELRIGFVVADIALGILPLAVDFATGKIYRKSPKAMKRK